MSDRGAIVGNVTEQEPPFAQVAPFLFGGSRSTDINAFLAAKSGWKLVTVTGINAAGQIVGTGYQGGVLQGYGLTP